MMKKKTAKKVQKHFTKLIEKISTSDQNATIILNIGKAESFVKALKLTEAIDYFTAENMMIEILEAERSAYIKKDPLK